VKSMEVAIHRGSHEIGGTCIELCAGDTRVILDIGMPLVKADGSEFDIRDYDGLTGEGLVDESVLPAVDGLYAWQKPSVDAVLISHAHMDHYGLLRHVHPDVPVYLSAGTQKLIEITASFTGKEDPLKNTLCFSWPSRFRIGAFTVRPHLVDHSSFSAFAFEIEAEGKRLFYSGDFREHGYLGKAMEILYREVRPGVDALLMEGTMLGRDTERVKTEEELSLEATELCKDSEKAILIYQSAQNISRAVSLFKAAKRSHRLFVPDIYTAHVLAELSHCPGGEKLPYPGKPGFEDVRVWYPKWLTNRLFKTDRGDIPLRYQPKKMTKPEMAADLGKVMLFVRPGMESDLRHVDGLVGSMLIYSLWEGYREKDKTRRFLAEIEALGVQVTSLHTSGHADIPALQRMANTLQPKQIVPVHTFNRDEYGDLFGLPVSKESFLEI
jgi:ribonuclease J